MKLAIRHVRDVVVVDVYGKLTGGSENSRKFQTVIKALVDDGRNRVVVNLRHTSWANSQGIGMMIGAYTIVKNAGGRLVLAHVVDRIKDILTVTRLLLIFKTFEKENEAVDYLVEQSEEFPDIMLLFPEETPPPRALYGGPA
jgi:anti-sigma B factor antagonist